MAALERSEFRLHAIADERSAAFFALGLRQGGHRPALISTSGSAPCHWHPALAEAAASQLDLMLITADRPSDLRRRGAPQSTDQRDLFAPQVSTFFEYEPKKGHSPLEQLTEILASLPMGESVHINVPLAKPLPLMDAPPVQVTLPDHSEALQPPLPTTPVLEGAGIVVAGTRAHRENCSDALAILLQSTGSSLLAESASGLRHDPGLRAFQELAPPETAPRWVLRLGHWPTPAAWRDALIRWTDAGIPVIGLGPEAQRNPLTSDALALPGAISPHLLAMCPPAKELRTYLGPTRTLHVSDTGEDQLLRGLAASLEADDVLVLGNSLSVRRFDDAVRPGHGPEAVYCNRGVCGIDGQLAFAVGLATATGRKTTCLLGDVSLFHDLNSLQLARHSLIPVRVIVLNNDGGRIFDSLPAASAMTVDHHRRFFQTPQNLDILGAAALFQLPAISVRPGDSAQLTRWLKDQEGSCLVELDLRSP